MSFLLCWTKGHFVLYVVVQDSCLYSSDLEMPVHHNREFSKLWPS